MDNKIFFSDGSVHINSRRFIANGHIFPIQDIHSVKLDVVPPRKRGLSLFSMVTGLVLLLDEGTLFVVGGLLIFVGIVTWLSAKTKFAVNVHTSRGEQCILSSRDRSYIEKVIHALDTALVNRVDPRDGDLLSTRETAPGANSDLSPIARPAAQ